jgi:S1-C subfamily serine protease
MGVDDADGVVVLSVRESSIAARLGFKAGDVIVEIGGEKVTDIASLEHALSAGRQRLWVMAVRRGDKLMRLQVPG